MQELRSGASGRGDFTHGFANPYAWITDASRGAHFLAVPRKDRPSLFFGALAVFVLPFPAAYRIVDASVVPLG